MSGQNANTTALMVERGEGAAIAFNSSGGADNWIMLLPANAGGVLKTVDGRGPYRVLDAAKLAQESLHAAGGRLPIDENHSTDLAAPKGGPSPARGWATALDARPDGIYGRIEWSAPGAALMSDKAYRYISPVFTHDSGHTVLRLLRASLTNTPNLPGMAALHAKENTMDLLAQLRKILGLANDADDAAVIAKIKDMAGGSTAMQSIALAAGLKNDADAPTIITALNTLKANTSLQSIAKAAGLKEDSDAATITTAVASLAAGKSPATDAAVTALQAELAGVTTSLNAVLASTAKDKATNYVDGEISRGRVGVKAMRDTYIAMHAADPAQVEKLIGAMPILGPSGTLQTAPVEKDGKVSLNAEQANAAKVLGLDPDVYAKKLAQDKRD